MGLNEIKVAKVNDLKNGEMKAVSVGEGKEILLTKVDGSYNALGANCTHYSGPLAEGILCNGVIMCPLHHACFDAKTGNLLDPPARDSLPRYETKIDEYDTVGSCNRPEPCNCHSCVSRFSEDAGEEVRE